MSGGPWRSPASWLHLPSRRAGPAGKSPRPSAATAGARLCTCVRFLEVEEPRGPGPLRPSARAPGVPSHWTQSQPSGRDFLSKTSRVSADVPAPVPAVRVPAGLCVPAARGWGGRGWGSGPAHPFPRAAPRPRRREALGGGRHGALQLPVCASGGRGPAEQRRQVGRRARGGRSRRARGGRGGLFTGALAVRLGPGRASGAQGPGESRRVGTETPPEAVMLAWRGKGERR